MMSLFVPEIAILEKVLRSVVVYLFMLAAFRFTGKRQVGQLTPFDLVLLLIISNVVQNAIIGPDNSLGGGLLGAVVILALNYAIVEVTFRSRRLRHLLEAQPTLLVHNGRILQKNLNRERIWLEDLHATRRVSSSFLASVSMSFFSALYRFSSSANFVASASTLARSAPFRLEGSASCVSSSIFWARYWCSRMTVAW